MWRSVTKLCSLVLPTVFILSALSACGSGEKGISENALSKDVNIRNNGDTGNIKNGDDTSCLVDLDCNIEETCQNNYCVKSSEVDSGIQMCISNSDCNEGEKCSGGACVTTDVEDGGNNTDVPTTDTQEKERQISVEPLTVDFGAIEPGTTVTKTVTIKNTSLLDLTVSAISFDSSTSEEFAFSPNPFPGTVLASDETLTVDITYTPIDATQDTGILLISNDSSEPLIEVLLSSQLKGEPDIIFYDANDADKKVWPKDDGSGFYIEFIAQDAGGKEEKTFLLRNNGTGNTPLEIGFCAIEKTAGTDYDQFKVTLLSGIDGTELLLPVYVNPSQEIAIRFTYEPKAKADHNATATIETNDKDVNNDGKAEDSKLQVFLSSTGEANEPALSVSTTKLEFGSVSVGATLTKQIALTNTGTGDLMINSTMLQNTPSDFSITSTPTTIAPKNSANIDVKFAPSAGGIKNDVLTINSNAKNAPVAIVLLEGTGETTCSPGATENEACGNCGTKLRTCGAGGEWNDWGECMNEGECTIGASEQETCGNCGTKIRTCGADCKWSAWGNCLGEGVCASGTTQDQTCGNCGAQTKTCNTNCQWGDYSTCTGEKDCAIGSSENQACNVCGSQTRTCSSACTWGTWGTCSISLTSAQDQYENNNSYPAAYYVGETSDCNENLYETQANIVPEGDTDWFKYKYADDSWCSIDHVKATLRNIPTGKNYDLVGYMDTSDCKNSPGCKNGSSTCDNTNPKCSGLPQGVKGCYSAQPGSNDEVIEFNCFAGGSDDTGNVFMQVVPENSTTGSCTNYTIVWDLK